MALWLVLEDFAGDLKYVAGGSFSIILAGTLADDAVINVPDALSQGCPMIPYVPATMAGPLAAFSAQGRRPPQMLNNDGNLLALLLGASALGGSTGSSFTFRPLDPGPAPYVYSDWQALYDATAPWRDNGLPFFVTIDLQYVGGVFAIPAGAWDFGGGATFAGPLYFAGFPGNPMTLQLGPGVTLSGIREITQILRLEGLGGTFVPNFGDVLAISRGGELIGTAAVLITQPAGSILVIAMFLGGGMRNNGTPVMDIPAGATALVVGAAGVATITTDTFSGVGGLQLASESPSADLYSAQTTFGGAVAYRVSYPATPLGTVDGVIPAAAGTYYLVLNNGAGAAAPVMDAYPLMAAALVRALLLLSFSFQWDGTGGGLGDTIDVEVTVNGATIALAETLVVGIAGMSQYQALVSVPELGIPLLAGKRISVKVKHEGLAAPFRLACQPFAG